MRIITTVVTLGLLGCGSDAAAPDAQSGPCVAPTAYLSIEHDCNGGAGICMADRGPVECFAKCLLYPNGYPMACGDGLRATSQATVDAEICYCVPN